MGKFWHGGRVSNVLCILTFLAILLSSQCWAQSAQMSVKWQFDTGKVHSSPAIGDDGTIYICADYSYVYAINRDGSLRWEATVGDLGDSAPAIALDGTVFVGSIDGSLYAIHPDGALWRFETEGPVRTTAALGVDGSVYIGSDDGSLYALTADGDLLWRFETGDCVCSSPAIGFSGEIYVGSDDHHLYAIRPDGTVHWKYKTGGAVRSSPAIGEDGTVYFGSEDGYVYALSPWGWLEWRVRIADFGASSPVIGSDGTVYVGSLTGYLHAIDPSGPIQWVLDTGEPLGSAPIVGEDGTVYVCSYEGKLWAVSSDGTKSREFETSVSTSCLHSAPVMGPDGIIYVGADDLYALRTDSLGPASSPWPMFHGGAALRGRAESTAMMVTFPLGWDSTVPLPKAAAAPPTDITLAPEVPTGADEAPSGLPYARFDTIPAEPSTLDDVRFFDFSGDVDGEIVSWEWSFGDGATSSQRAPTHRYEQKREFTVSLTVTDDSGLTNTVTKYVVVRNPPLSLPEAWVVGENLPPEACFNVDREEIRVGEEVVFDASPSHDRDGMIVSYLWLIGGSEVKGKEARWSFSEPGTYTVILETIDDFGESSRFERTISVTSLPANLPFFKNQWALVVGISQYDDQRIGALEFAEEDARAFSEYLVNPYGGGFSERNVRKLLGSQATQRTIKTGFEWLLKNTEEGDLVVFYFAGHGGYGKDYNNDEEDKYDEYLFPFDVSKTSLFGTAIRDDEIADWLSSLASEHVLVVLDCCFSGGAIRGDAITPFADNRIFQDFVGEGRLILAASQEDEVSYEDPNLGHGVFTYFLLRGLGASGDVDAPQADLNSDGRVTIEELNEYLVREVPAYVKDIMKEERSQCPLIRGDHALLEKVSLNGHAESLRGEVKAAKERLVLISLGEADGIRAGDRFEVVQPYLIESHTVIEEVIAEVKVAQVLSTDRSYCTVTKLNSPIKVGHRVRPVS